MNQAVLKEIESPSIFKSFINKEASPLGSVSEFTLDFEDNIFSSKKNWNNKDVLISTKEINRDRRDTQASEIPFIEDEEFKDNDILEINQ